MNDYQLLVKLISSTIILVSKDVAITSHDKKEICMFIEHGEWGIAFEYLCSCLEQSGITLSKEKYNAINAVGEIMGMERDLWSKIMID